MSIQIPNHKRIREAFRAGEDAVVALFDEFGGQLIEIAKQLQKQSSIIQELQAKASKNSGNSSKPPSSDGYGKQNRTTSLRRKGEKPNGGQAGHKGETLKAVEKPDEIKRHDAVCCKKCQSSLEDVTASFMEERQVFDIPAMKIVITAHQATVKICPECQTENKGEFPEDVSQSVQYGNGVKTAASYFNNEHFIPVARTAQIFQDLYGQAPSEATILKASKQLNQHIQPAREAVKEMLHQEPLLNADETGLRVEGKLHWLHSVSTDKKLTDYEVHPRRGKEAMDAAGILEGYQGKLVHDHWKPYFRYEDCQHIACNAHHLRELKYIENQYQQAWAGETATLLVGIKNKISEVKSKKSYISKAYS
jgi:transposase